MPSSTNNNLKKNKNKNNKNKNKNKVKLDIVPNGKSYIDFLPEEVLYTINLYQHQLIFNDSLNFIKKLRIVLDSEISDSKIPLKKLLKKATDKKLIYIDVGMFDCSHYNNSVDDMNKSIKKEFKTDKIQIHKGLLPQFTQIEIKLTEKMTLLIIDVLDILYELGLTRRINNKVVDVITEDLRKSAMIHFTLECF